MNDLPEELTQSSQSSYSFGVCRYCGQTISLLPPEYSQEAADRAATERCDCFEAGRARRLREQVTDAKEALRSLLCGKTPGWEYQEPVMSREELLLLNGVMQGIADGVFNSATLDVRGICKAKIAIDGKGNLKVSRTETRSAEKVC